MPSSFFENYIQKESLEKSELLAQALTHKSCSKEDRTIANYERLEFLGDAVLKLVFSEYLFAKFPEEEEGNLSKYRSRLISDDLLAKLADISGLKKFVRIGKMLRGQKNIPESVYGDALEALLGVIYLEYNYDKAKNFILELWDDHIETAIKESIDKNFNALLIEKIQAKHGKAPEFKIIKSTGQAHDMDFVVGVFFEDQLLATGEGKSKKIAGQLAAKAALQGMI